MTDVVIFQEISCDNDKKIGVITLNSPKSLNALTGDMVALLYPQLILWQKEQSIVAVFLQGEGDKAFCAGGDIVHLYNEMKNNSQSKKSITSLKSADKLNDNFSPAVEKYFTQEYKLDFLIHRFEKPLIVWGSGIVMGGGLGLLVGASHRVVTESSRIAMPEISIGLFPDVGASYFLNKMPTGCGIFLALTGASINATDAKYCQLADYFIEQKQKNNLLEQLKTIDWEEKSSLNHHKVSQRLKSLEQSSMNQLPESALNQHKKLITSFTENKTLIEISSAIINVDTEDKWFSKAQKSLKNGSPLSAQLAYSQLEKTRGMSLENCFRLELNLAVKCGHFGEFTEGVRALLIDKDNSPKWHYSTVELINEEVLQWFFESIWSDSKHPLANLTH